MDIVSKVTIREALVSDHGAVLEIVGGLWQGVDHLHHTYTQYMADPQCRAYVAVYQHTVIGFCRCYLLRDDVCVLTGLKVAPQFVIVKQSLVRKLTEGATRAFLQSFPRVRRVLHSSIDSIMYDVHRRTPGALAYDRHFIKYRTNTELLRNLTHSLQQWKSSASRDKTRIVDDQESLAILSRQANVSKFFPEAYFLHGVDSTLSQVNLADLAAASGRDGTKVIASTSTQGHLSDGISFGSCVLTPNGPFFNFRFHGEEVDVLLEHLLCLLESYRELLSTDRTAVMELVFPKNMEKYSVKKALFRCLGDRLICEDVPREGLIVVEEHLHMAKL